MEAVLASPLVYALVAILGFVAKDLFNKVQRTSEMKSDIEGLKQRVTSLEVSHKEHSEMSKAVIRLEEQVKRLAEDIKFLLTILRSEREYDKTHGS